MADEADTQSAPSATASVSVSTSPAAQINITPPAKDFMRNFVGCSVIVGFVGIIILMCWHPLPTENHDIIISLVSFMGGAFTGVCAFFYGSTSSSHAKDAAISALSGAPQSKG